MRRARMADGSQNDAAALISSGVKGWTDGRRTVDQITADELRTTGDEDFMHASLAAAASGRCTD